MPVSSFRIQLPSTRIGRYVRHVLGFGVAVAVGMAPFLGKKEVPFFEPLVDLFSETSKIPLIPLSAFLMGFVALRIQFYAGDKISSRTINRRFAIWSTIMLVAFTGFVVIYTERVLQVPEPRTGSNMPVILGWQRLPTGKICACLPSENDLMCAYSLGLGNQLKNLEICWPSIWQVRLSLHLLYLGLTSGFGAMIGLLLLKEEALQQAKARREEKAKKEEERAKKAEEEKAREAKSSKGRKRHRQAEAAPEQEDAPAAPPSERATPQE